MGLIDLPQSKWDGGTGRQAILKGDFAKIEAAVLQSFGIMAPPSMVWVDASGIKVPATADCMAPILLNGFPNILHPGMMVGGGLTDGRYRENTADAAMDFDLSTALWGSEKTNQWYFIYALAGNADTEFSLKAMPMMRVDSQASQVISLGWGLGTSFSFDPIGYGFATDELADGLIYVLSGASAGLMRAITANNNDNSTGGTITYSGESLTLAQGDWFVVLPPATNFRLIGTIFNGPSSNIVPFAKVGNRVKFLELVQLGYYGSVGQVVEVVPGICPLASAMHLHAGGALGTYIAVSHPDYMTNPWAIYSATLGWTPVKFCKLGLWSFSDVSAIEGYEYSPNFGL